MRPEDFERLYAEHAARIYSFVAYRVGDPQLAEDLTADVFERALRARRRYDSAKGSEQTWLYAIAVNRVRDQGRRRAAERRAIDRLPAAPSETGDSAERLGTSDEVLRAVAALSPDEREVVALRYGADLTAPQIAEALDQPLTTVEGRLYRALRKLRAALGPAEPG